MYTLQYNAFKPAAPLDELKDYKVIPTNLFLTGKKKRFSCKISFFSCQLIGLLNISRP